MPDTADSLSPIDRYHSARRRGDPPTAKASLALALSVSGYRGEAQLLAAIEALRAGRPAHAFLRSAAAHAALPRRHEPVLLMAKAAELQNRPELAAQIAALAQPPARVRAVPPPAPGPRPRAQRVDDVVDVLVPVYAGREATLACVRSVLAHAKANRTPHRLVVLDDASPDAQLAAELRRLGETGALDYRRNARNLGFIGNMNGGMALRPWRDVVWLNADTRVHGDWLDRLRAAVLHSPRTASATPWSNDGQLMSLPRPLQRAEMPDEEQQALLHEAARSASLALSSGERAASMGAPTAGPVEIEAACGFCMYVRRDALDEVGWLDDQALAGGYGEDTDWSIRARLAGWRHVAAVDTFVAHVGNVSFGPAKRELVRRNNDVIRARHPDAERRFDAAVLRDVLAPARQAVQRARLPELAQWLSSGPASRGLTPSPLRGEGGGEGRATLHVQPDIFKPNRPVSRTHIAWAAPKTIATEPALTLRFSNHGPTARASLHAALPGVPLALDYRLPEDHGQLASDLRALALQGIVIHHRATLPAALAELPQRLGLPYRLRCEDDSLLLAGEMTPLLKAAQAVELPWAALVPAWRAAFPGLRVSGPQPAPALPQRKREMTNPATLLIADALDRPAVANAWLAWARELARRGAPVLLLLAHDSPWEPALLASGVVAPLPEPAGLEPGEVLALCGCTAAVSLDAQPGAGWLAPAAAAAHGLPLYAPDSAVAREAGAHALDRWPLAPREAVPLAA